MACPSVSSLDSAFNPKVGLQMGPGPDGSGKGIGRSDLLARLGALEKANDVLRQQNSDLEDENATLQGLVKSLESQVDELKDSIGDLNASIKSLKTDTDGDLKKNLETITDAIEQLKQSGMNQNMFGQMTNPSAANTWVSMLPMLMMTMTMPLMMTPFMFGM